ncbi:MAG: hypothetical protein NVS3B2_08360 [Ramlibacter sp.]
MTRAASSCHERFDFDMGAQQVLAFFLTAHCTMGFDRLIAEPVPDGVTLESRGSSMSRRPVPKHA